MALVSSLLPIRLFLPLVAVVLLGSAPAAAAFGFDDVDRLARDLASRPQPSNYSI